MKSRSLASRRDRPLIGVTTSEMRRAESVNPTPEGEPRPIWRWRWASPTCADSRRPAAYRW